MSSGLAYRPIGVSYSKFDLVQQQPARLPVAAVLAVLLFVVYQGIMPVIDGDGDSRA
jgi:hypothetical protein